jgi:3-oxoacyl-[acyl-carrier protein] reductase
MTIENEIKSLGDRVVVITGGGTGIGRAMAEAFARYGGQVVILGRHEDTLRGTAEAIGSNCSWQQADVSRSAQVTAAVNAIVARLGKIDVLINNAGYSGFERGLNVDMTLEQAEEIWNDQISINLTGAFLMSLAVIPHLQRPGARIINISSDAALTGGPGLRLAGYAAAKAGLLGLTRSLAIELGPQGITVNVIAPGAIMTGPMPKEAIKSITAMLPLRRVGNVNDIASAALFLASPEAGFITGELMNINGGRVFGR